jgi:diguanylate cyclase (GGDEF)-like protein
MNHNILDLSTLSYDKLLEYATKVSIDRSFEIMKKEACLFQYENISNGEIVILIDIANMHAMNHFYSMNGVDTRIKNFCAELRSNDIVAKFGGDELVIIVKSTNDIIAYTDRIVEIMRSNDLYGVIAVTFSNNGLNATFNHLDTHLSSMKLALETLGLKADRNAEYACGLSQVIYC